MEPVDFEGPGLARFQTHQRAALPGFEVACIGSVFLESVGHDRFALGGGQDLVAQADQPPGGDLELHVLDVALGLHDLEHALAHHHQFRCLARVGLRHVDDEVFERFVTGVLDLLVDDPGLADLQLVAFAAHGLDEDGQMQDAATEDGPLVLAVGGLNAQREVLLQFLFEALADVSAGQVFSVLAQEGRGIDGEQQAHRGLIHGDAFHGLGLLEIRQGVANLEVVDAGDGAKVAGAHMVHLFLAQSAEDEEFLGADLALTVRRAEHVVLIGVQISPEQAADGDPSSEAAVIE